MEIFYHFVLISKETKMILFDFHNFQFLNSMAIDYILQIHCHLNQLLWLLLVLSVFSFQYSWINYVLQLKENSRKDSKWIDQNIRKSWHHHRVDGKSQRFVHHAKIEITTQFVENSLHFDPKIPLNSESLHFSKLLNLFLKILTNYKKQIKM